MPLEPKEVTELLRGASCRGLDAYQQRLLAGRCRGTSFADVAAVWGYSESNVRYAFRAIEDIVLGHLGLEHDIALMTSWFDLHLECCLPIARDFTERGAVFAPPFPERSVRRQTA